MTFSSRNPQRTALLARTKRFALDVIALLEVLPKSELGRIIGRQLLRSATSVGANYRAACRARTRAVFISKLDTVVEEADESAFWLEILVESGTIGAETTERLLDEANQLTSIFSASRATAIRNRPRKNRR